MSLPTPALNTLILGRGCDSGGYGGRMMWPGGEGGAHESMPQTGPS